MGGPVHKRRMRASGFNQGTSIYGINPAGTSLGPNIDSSGVNHGYVRTADGDITRFDVPGAGTGNALSIATNSGDALAFLCTWRITGKPEVNCRNQAISQLCAFSSPSSGILSVNDSMTMSAPIPG